MPVEMYYGVPLITDDGKVAMEENCCCGDDEVFCGNRFTRESCQDHKKALRKSTMLVRLPFLRFDAASDPTHCTAVTCNDLSNQSFVLQFFEQGSTFTGTGTCVWRLEHTYPTCEIEIMELAVTDFTIHGFRADPPRTRITFRMGGVHSFGTSFATFGLSWTAYLPIPHADLICTRDFNQFPLTILGPSFSIFTPHCGYMSPKDSTGPVLVTSQG